MKVLQQWDTFPLAKAIREDKACYGDFLVYRLVEICLDNGWEYPAIVRKLATPEQLQAFTAARGTSPGPHPQASRQGGHDGDDAPQEEEKTALDTSDTAMPAHPLRGGGHAPHTSSSPFASSFCCAADMLMKGPAPFLTESRSAMLVLAFLLWSFFYFV